MAEQLWPAQSGPALPALIGRAQPLARLVTLVDAARAGYGRVALVTGEAGMGKTRLAEAVAEVAGQRGLRVAWGWCSHDDAPAYGPWAPALRPLDIGLPLLSGGAVGTATTERQLVFNEVAEELRALAERQPLLIVLEDMHCADVPSLRLLRVVSAATPGSSMLVLGTSRDDPLDSVPDVWRLLTALPPAVERIALGGLDADSTLQLAADALGSDLPPSVAATLHARTGGNPFFAREVARLIASQGAGHAATVPSGVRELLQRRFARVSQGCHDLLGIAAVAGEDAGMVLLSAVAGREEEAVLELVDEAARARLVDVDVEAASVAFVHALVREVRYAALGARERAALHRAVAAHLEEHAPDLDAVAGRLSFHWIRAGQSGYRDRAAGWALRAGRAAMARYGFEQAVPAFRHALHGPDIDRIEILLELGAAQFSAGDLAGARSTYGDAAELARAEGRPEELARAALGPGGGIAGFEVRLYDEAQVRLLQDTLATLPADDSALRAAVLARLALALSEIGEPSDQIVLAEEAVAMARRVGDGPGEVAALAAYCDTIAGPNHVDERLASATRMLGLAEQAQDTVGALLARRLRLVAMLEAGDIALADAEITAYARTADRLGQPLYTWCVPIWRGMRALMSGDAAEAERRADEAEEIGRRAGSDNARFMVYSLRVAARRATGQIASMRPQFLAILDEFSEHPQALASTSAFIADLGDLELSANLARRAVAAGLDALPRDAEWIEALWCLGDTALALGDRAMAGSVLDALRPYAGIWAIDGMGGACFGVTAHQLGRLATFLDRPDEAAPWLAYALDRHRAAGASLLVAATRAAQAQLGGPRVTQDRTDAEPHGTFHREGRVWRVAWYGKGGPVPHSKGMTDLATLLAQPGRQVHVLDLVEVAGGPPAAAAGGDLGPALDATARTAYRRRVTELDEELHEAEANADQARAERLADERDFLVRELASALGLGGRGRRVGDPVERARKSVAQRIGTAVRAIEDVHPELARHLRLAVSTGRFCVYQPEQEVVWKT